jgi:superfamily II DNA or RNA helicase
MIQMNERNLSTLDLKISYQTEVDDPINGFYLPCLNQAKEFYRAVGYFRSSIFLITGEAIINYVKAGGKIKLICSPEITQQDMDAIESGKSNNEEVVNQYVYRDIEDLISESNENYAITVLATLIKINALEIKIAIKQSQRGIFHAKIGVFKDDLNNQVSFIGSANESWSGWDPEGNHEIIDVFCSWKEDSERVAKHKQDFDKLWYGLTPGIDTRNFSDAMRDQIIKIAEDNIENIDLKKLREIKLTLSSDKKIYKLLDHQKIALINWKSNGYRGIFQHATGSGKTITALKAIEDHVKTGGVALILVPSSLLLQQWTIEINREIDSLSLIVAGSGNNKWKHNNLLRYFVAEATSTLHRVVLSTMQTASTNEFINSFTGINNLLIVADEVHQIGSNKNSRSMEIQSQKRLGLSATPQRYSDPEGTKNIIRYFGDIVEPIFTLADAIRAKRLVEYEYYPHLISLTAEEADKWKIETEKIKKEIAITNNNKDSFFLSLRAKMLTIQRSRIAKKSISKLGLVKKVIKDNYEIGQKWLIYCEDIEQLREVKKIIIDLKFDVFEFYSKMDGDSIETLNLYQHRGGILVSIKCLDEGVDIPSISHALIIASSQNPRQFIQRRGRVLRTYGKLKKFAVVHDALIVPINLDKEPEQLSLLRSEMVRAYEFASHAINKSAKGDLRLKAIELGVNLDDILTDGIEEDSDAEIIIEA